MKIFKLLIAAATILFILMPTAKAAENNAEPESTGDIDYTKFYGIQNLSVLDLELVQVNERMATYSTNDYKSGLFDNYPGYISKNTLPKVVYDNRINSIGDQYSGQWCTDEVFEIQLTKNMDFTGIYVGVLPTSQNGPAYIEFLDKDNKLITRYYTPKNEKQYVNESVYLSVDIKNVSKIKVYKIYCTVLNELEFFIDPASLFSSVVNLEVNNITSESAVINWTNPDDVFLNSNKFYIDGVLKDTQKRTSYNLNNLTPYTTYKVTVSAVYNGIEVKRDITFTTAKDTTPPNNVTDFKVEQKGKNAVLSWVNATDDDFSHVRIYRDNVLWQDNITGTTITDNDLKYNSTYTYNIVSVDLSGNTSNGVVKNLKVVEIKAQVTDLKAVSKDYSQVELTWKNPQIDGFETVTIYRKVEQKKIMARLFSLFSSDDSEDYTPIFQTNGTLFKDLTVAAETTYEYKLTTVVSGAETDSVTTQVTTPKLSVINPEIEKDPVSGDYLFKWDLPTKGQVKILIDDKQFAVVNAADKQKLIPSSELKYDVLGNPRTDLIKVIAIDENGDEGGMVKPIITGGIIGGGGDLVTSAGINATDLLLMGVGLLGLVGMFILLGLAFKLAPKLINLIRTSFVVRRG